MYILIRHILLLVCLSNILFIFSESSTLPKTFKASKNEQLKATTTKDHGGEKRTVVTKGTNKPKKIVKASNKYKQKTEIAKETPDPSFTMHPIYNTASKQPSSSQKSKSGASKSLSRLKRVKEKPFLGKKEAEKKIQSSVVIPKKQVKKPLKRPLPSSSFSKLNQNQSKKQDEPTPEQELSSSLFNSHLLTSAFLQEMDEMMISLGLAKENLLQSSTSIGTLTRDSSVPSIKSPSALESVTKVDILSNPQEKQLEATQTTVKKKNQSPSTGMVKETHGIDVNKNLVVSTTSSNLSNSDKTTQKEEKFKSSAVQKNVKSPYKDQPSDASRSVASDHLNIIDNYIFNPAIFDSDGDGYHVISTQDIDEADRDADLDILNQILESSQS